MGVRLNAHQQKQLHNIDDDLKEINGQGNAVNAKAKVGKDMDELEKLLQDMPSDVSDTVKGALQGCLFALKDAVKGNGTDPVDLDKVGEAEAKLGQAMGEQEEEE